MHAGPVLIGASGSAASLRATAHAASLYDIGHLVAIIVADEPLGTAEAERRRADIFSAVGTTIPVEVHAGRPGPTLCAEARRRDATAVVVGLRAPDSRLRLWRRLTQPVVHHVVTHAPCPVLVGPI